MGNSRQFASEYRFHPFEVDLDSRELRKHGVRLHLHDQPFQVLALLLTRRGEVVTREELRRALWASGTFVDFENGLNSAVNRLREALCDSAKHPRYIETIPRRGYRFIATLEPDPKPSNTGPPDHREGHPPHAATISNMSSNVFRGLMLTTGVLVLLALMPVAAWRPFQKARTVPLRLRQLRPVPLVTYANGSQWLPAFSPDGSRIAYSWQDQTGWYLEIKEVGTDARLRLTRSPASSPPGPAWSPDGRQIAFTRAGATDERGVFVISAFGGTERKLRPLAAWRVPQRLVSWSPDGKWIAFADETDKDPTSTSSSRGPNAIYLISPETLETRRLTQPSFGDFGDAAPAFSPDGTTIAFVRTTGASHDVIYKVAVEGGAPKQMVSVGIWTNGLTWSADGKSIVFDRSVDGGFRLWEVSSTGGEPHALDLPSSNANLLEPSLWHDRLVYESHETSETVGSLRLDEIHPKLITTPVASTRTERAGRYSPDGKHIAFISNRTGGDELWVADADGSDPAQLTHLGMPLADLSWDPGGKSLALSTCSGKVFLVSIEMKSSRLVLEGVPFIDEDIPNIAFSRNGNVIYVLREPGIGEQYELLSVPVGGGSPAKVMEGRLTNFADSLDGETLFYSRAGSIWRRAVRGGVEQFVAPDSGLWDLGPDGLYLLAPSSIKLYSLDGRRQRTIARLGHFDAKFPMSVSPDAHSVLFGHEQRQTVEIDMVPEVN